MVTSSTCMNRWRCVFNSAFHVNHDTCTLSMDQSLNISMANSVPNFYAFHLNLKSLIPFPRYCGIFRLFLLCEKNLQHRQGRLRNLMETLLFMDRLKYSGNIWTLASHNKRLMAKVGLGKVTIRILVVPFSCNSEVKVSTSIEIVTSLFFCVEKSNEQTTKTKYVNLKVEKMFRIK